MHVMIVGIRGVPARHGGFETFAEDLARYLVGHEHEVTVYCQSDESDEVSEDVWNGIRRVSIPSPDTALGTVAFDWATTVDASRAKGVVLTLGYNTATFSLLYRLRHLPNVMNMDGIEWMRDKWSSTERLWLRMNEWTGARLAHHLIADHPEVAAHLRRHTRPDKITVIPYGAEVVQTPSTTVLEAFGLRPKTYYLLIARPEPENSILEIVSAFSSPRVLTPLVVLGTYEPGKNAYHREVFEAAGPQVFFLGPIYDREQVQSLRFYAKAYIHGHRVGGTNPSLVETLAAGGAVIAHDNCFNRWVAGEHAKYFATTAELEQTLQALEANSRLLLEMEEGSRRRHGGALEKEQVMAAYEQVLLRAAKSGH